MHSQKDIPQSMKKLRIDLLSILVLALIIVGAILVWGEYAGIKTSEARSACLSAVAISALILAFFASFDRLGRWSDAVRSLGQWLHIRAPEMVGTTQGALAKSANATRPTGTGLSALQEHLRAENGVRWRYRQSWLLLTGEEAIIARALPTLATNGWLATQDAVLLWNKAGADGRPDENWLRQVYALRRRRPIDAVVLMLDGAAEASLQRRGASNHSVNLARIANALHWSAPVYVLDIAQTDEFADGRTALIGCEFTPNSNERAIESTLLALRSRVGHKAIEQLIRSDNDRYGARLSQRLDTLSAPLAALIASLSNRKERHQPVSGAFFAPFPTAIASADAKVDPNAPTSADLPLWTHLASIRAYNAANG
jgi:type VI secretion system protein ImpL